MPQSFPPAERTEAGPGRERGCRKHRFFVFDANRANDLVDWTHHSANWLAGWSRDLFTPDNAKWRTVLNYGLPAVVYLLAAHAVAGRVNRG
jgi:hypothetical protein